MRLPDARIAVVDVGSNSVRLFLCDGVDASGPSGERTTTVVGLRRGAAADGTLAEDALARLDGCLAGYAVPTARFAPDRIVAVGTSAVRDAPNRDRSAATTTLVSTTICGPAIMVSYAVLRAESTCLSGDIKVNGIGKELADGLVGPGAPTAADAARRSRAIAPEFLFLGMPR